MEEEAMRRHEEEKVIAMTKQVSTCAMIPYNVVLTATTVVLL